MSEPIQVKVPFENVNDPTAKIVDWKLPSGSQVKKDDIIVELETTKTTFPVTAPAAGFLEYHLPLGEEVPVGENLFRIHADEASARTPHISLPKAQPPPVPPVSTTSGSPLISKRAQELMAAHGLEVSVFAGRSVVKESDVREKIASLKKDPPPPAAVPPIPQEISRPKPPMEEPGELVPLGRAKQVENRELAAVAREVLKSTLYYFCPANGFHEACARQQPPVQRLAVVLFELAKLLKKYPSLNAFYTDNSMFVYRHVHLGFAVDMGQGLKVLVIREAEMLNFTEFTAKVEDLLVKYAMGDLAVKEISGSTFTVTDLAQTGAFSFEPLINTKQAAILGIGAESRFPGTGANGFMLSCAFDHRVNSGRFVAEFLAELSARLVGHAASLQAGTEPPFCSRCLQTVDELRAIQAFLIPSTEPPGYLCSHCLLGH